MTSLHAGGCTSAGALAGAARELDELRTSLTDARFVLAMLVKALEDSKEIDLDDSGEYEAKLVREAKRVLAETERQVTLGSSAEEDFQGREGCALSRSPPKSSAEATAPERGSQGGAAP